ncbi:MAG: DUF5110 domain-containing protein [Verrucomicrobia bacterium]|nr:DUF5110 domain-containing protein [Verrucomicrobiota bacterium]
MKYLQISDFVRVSILSPTLLRFEERGPEGFEDNPTLLVVDREWPGAEFRVIEDGSLMRIELPGCMILAERTGNVDKVWSSIEVREKDSGTSIWSGGDKTSYEPDCFAPPGKKRAWVLSDSPRLIPPPWGACPPPEDQISESDPLYHTSGWDLSFKGRDKYLFLLSQGPDHSRKEYLKLTGQIPLLPLWAFGFWTSLYYPFTEEDALRDIDAFCERDYPLDVFVLDTDWRVGGSGGYDVEKKYFPDMQRFIDRAHKKNVRLMFNDHPQPNGMAALEPAMLKFRYKGLTGFLDMGLDSWWYDQNWPDSIREPDPGMDQALWGQYLFWNIIRSHTPDKRTMIMSMRSRNHGSHRFPIWWTGDIQATYKELETGICDSVEEGLRLLPYVHQDLGGHIGQPDDELYVRFLQYGCLGTITRIHGTYGEGIFRYPWLFGEEAADIVREYAKLRYRLLPVIYTAARRAYDDGTPILRKPSLGWPEHREAHRSDEYLLGDDLLVAPVTKPADKKTRVATSQVWIPPGMWQNLWTGNIVYGPTTIEEKSTLRHIPLYVRRGGALITAPEMGYTGQRPWDPITVMVFPGHAGTILRELYEDAGEGLGYQSGEYARTRIEITGGKDEVSVKVNATEGRFPGQLQERTWRIRVNLVAERTLLGVCVDGREQEIGRDIKVLKPKPGSDEAMVMMGWGRPPRSHAGDIVELEFKLPLDGSREVVIKAPRPQKI